MVSKTSWTCPDCCVNPCECSLMGDASTRKDEGATACHRPGSPANIPHRKLSPAHPTLGWSHSSTRRCK